MITINMEKPLQVFPRIRKNVLRGCGMLKGKVVVSKGIAGESEGK